MRRMQQDLEALKYHWHTPAGRTIWHREAQVLARIAPSSTVRMLEMSMGASLNRVFAPAMHVRWADTFENSKLMGAHYIADGCAQPFDECTFDTVLVHHVLDCVPSPRLWLSEAVRMTANHGRLYLIGWNIWQPRWPKRRDASPVKRRILLRQIRNWLAFVDFEIEQVHYCAFSTAQCRAAHLYEHLGSVLDVPLGGSYIVVARREHQDSIPRASRQCRRHLLKVGHLQSGLLSPVPNTMPEHDGRATTQSTLHATHIYLSGHHEQH